MAFTKIVGAGIHTLSNVNTHNINSSGIITATQFVGIFTGTDGDFSGNVTIDGNLTVNGTTTTLDTNLTEVDKVEVAANNSTVGVAITQSGSGDILNLYDGSTEVFSVKDGGSVRVGDNATYSAGTGSDDLVIGATTGQHGMTILTGNNSSSINFADSASSNPGAITYQHNGSNYMRFRVAGNERVRITSGGNVGIGTDNPGSQSSAANNLVVAEFGGEGGITIKNDTNSMGHIFFADTDATAQGRIDYGHSGDYMRFYTANDERLRIDSGGRVGINTTTNSMDGVTGNLNIANDNYNNHTVINLSRNTASDRAQIRFQNPNGNIGSINTFGSDFAIYAANDVIFGASNGDERLRITSGGEVKIADGGFLSVNTNPGSTYGVSEALRIDDGGNTNDRPFQIYEYHHSGSRYHRIQFNTITTTNGSAYTYTQGNYGGSSSIHFDNLGDLRFYTDAQVTGGSQSNITPTERLRILSDGGITVQQGNNHYPTTFIGGSTAGRNYLTVRAGNTTSGHYSGFNIQDSSANHLWQFGVQHNTDDLDIFGNSAGGNLRFWTKASGAGSSTIKMQLTAAGDLHQEWRDGAFIGQKYDSDYYMGLTFGVSSRTLFIDNRSNDTRADIVFRTIEAQSAPAERLRIRSTGYVGIQTADPKSFFHASRPSTCAVTLNFGDPVAQILQCEDSEFALGLHNASPYPLFIQGRTRVNTARQIVLNPLGGNIGIGTINPDSKLNLVGGGSDANTRISIKDGVGIANVVGRYGNLVFEADADNAVNGSVMTFKLDGSEKVRITSDGKVGIGTFLPDLDLHIKKQQITTYIKNETTHSNSSYTGINLRSPTLNFQIWNQGPGATGYSGSNSVVFWQAASTGPYAFYHGNNERLRIATDKVMFSVDAKVDTTNTRDLGASGAKWKTLYLGTQLNIAGQGASNATPRLLIEDGTGGDNDFSISQYEDANGTYTLIGQNVQLNGSGSEVIQDSNHKTASIYLDARNNGAIFFNTGGTNAHTEALRIDSSGRLLIRGQAAFSSTSLDHRLQVKSQNTGDAIAIIGRAGDSSGVLTFLQNDASTSTAFIYANPNDLTLRSQSDLVLQSNGATERMRISDTEITTTNSVGMEIYGGAANHPNDSVFYVHKTSNADWAIKCDVSNGTSSDYGMFSRVTNSAAYAYGVNDTSTWRFRVNGAGSIFATNTTVQSISDVRLKENIVDANSQWDDIKALRFRNYKWKTDSGRADGKTYLGLIAQEVEPISPGLVEIDAQTKEDIENNVPDPEYKNVKYSIVWMKAVKALQEAQARIEQLEAKVAALEGS